MCQSQKTGAQVDGGLSLCLQDVMLSCFSGGFGVSKCYLCVAVKSFLVSGWRAIDYYLYVPTEYFFLFKYY